MSGIDDNFSDLTITPVKRDRPPQNQSPSPALKAVGEDNSSSPTRQLTTLYKAKFNRSSSDLSMCGVYRGGEGAQCYAQRQCEVQWTPPHRASSLPPKRRWFEENDGEDSMVDREENAGDSMVDWEEDVSDSSDIERGSVEENVGENSQGHSNVGVNQNVLTR